MSCLIEQCVRYFNTGNLYHVLGCVKSATMIDLKEGYHKKALVHHPDRVEHKEKIKATKMFQVLSQVHCILSDNARRAQYDETGQVDEEMSVEHDKDWNEYWRLLFPRLTLEVIQEFTENYKGSEQELRDLKMVYMRTKGDMNKIMEQMICCDLDDEPRFTRILQDMIDEKKIPDFKAFSKESEKRKKARARKAKREAKEANEEIKRLKLDQSGASRMSMITQRQASRTEQVDSFLDQMEAKYGGSSGEKKKGIKRDKR